MPVYKPNHSPRVLFTFQLHDGGSGLRFNDDLCMDLTSCFGLHVYNLICQTYI